MQYSVQLGSSLAVTPMGLVGNELIKPKAYLDLEESSHSQLGNI